MAQSYDQLNPQSILRDVLIDPAPDVGEGFAYPKIFGIPQMGSGGIASGRAIDLSGTPGALSGKLLVRSARDILGAAAEGSVAKPVGSPRDLAERYPLTEVAFTMQQFDGYSREKKEFVENGFSADEEAHLARMAASAVHIKMERYAADFFTAIAADAAAEVKGGWTELNWTGGFSGTALGTSNTTMETLHKCVQSLRKDANQPVNACYIPQSVMEKLQRDPQVLGRIVIATAGGAATAVADSVAPANFVIDVLKQHLGFDEVVVGSGVHQAQGRGLSGSNSYIWPDNRMWIGCAGDVQFSLRSGSAPRVLSGSGAFCKVYTKVMDTDIGFEKKVGPQYLECTVDSICEMVALVPSKGGIIHNL
jgi:hypothetical protein